MIIGKSLLTDHERKNFLNQVAHQASDSSTHRPETDNLSAIIEIEDFEYDEMIHQIEFFRKHYSIIDSKSDLLRPPAHISRAVVTCDNSELKYEDLLQNNNEPR